MLGTPIIVTPENDLCENATSISCGETATGSTATATSEDLEFCGTSISTAPGVWYSIVGDGSEITINTFESAYDTKLAVFSGSCAEKYV